ncbi:MAG: putative anti-sigma regulatory factor, serine/threonine protein kinase [Pseudonocardiales bacterium]|jgi:serine/threonine-protein kinase RsbW|nr:putative anti-sigma regulatory factor, serine/threonine protein kinase [Pseudonocardiales bacterium]
MHASERPDGDVVEVRVPADVAYVSTLRLAAAGLAARCELTIDDIEDLRLAVDEACALLLPHADKSSILDARFELNYGCLAVDVAVATEGPAELDRKGFAWTVLGALASSIDIEQTDDRVTISLTKRREATSQ